MGALTKKQAASIAALVVVAIIIVAFMFSPHRCFLDVLNWQIAKGCEFRPFYAGVVGLPAPRELIPALGDLEDAFPVIQAEALGVFADRQQIPRMHEVYNKIFMRDASFPPARWALDKAMRAVYGKDTDIFDKIGSRDWQTFNLIIYGRDVPGNVERCPTLVSLLKRVPGVQSALISIIAPGTYIPPHSDPAKGVIRYHLAFKVPRDRSRCFIVVDGTPYHWEEGRSVLFDDVYEHWVRNDTDEYRVILFVDILRPLRGVPGFLQGLANLTNRYHPGVRQLIRDSRVAA